MYRGQTYPTLDAHPALAKPPLMMSARTPEGVVATRGHDYRNDPNMSPAEKAAYARLSDLDTRFSKEQLSYLASWINLNKVLGKGLQLEFDPNQIVIYEVADTKGTDKQRAVMWCRPGLEFMTDDGKVVKGGFLGSPLHLDDMIRDLGKDNPVKASHLEEYAITHEYMHMLSTKGLLSKDVKTVERTTDMYLQNYFSSRAATAQALLATAKDQKERDLYLGEIEKYTALAGVAAGRVRAIDQGRIVAPAQRTSNGRIVPVPAQ